MCLLWVGEKSLHFYHDIAMTITSFDIPVVTSSPDIDVTLTSSHVDGMTTAPGGLTTSKDDTTEGVTATKVPTSSKKYFFKVWFSMFLCYAIELSSHLCQFGAQCLSDKNIRLSTMENSSKVIT